jgi:hypothetical protein
VSRRASVPREGRCRFRRACGALPKVARPASRVKPVTKKPKKRAVAREIKSSEVFVRSEVAPLFAPRAVRSMLPRRSPQGGASWIWSSSPVAARTTGTLFDSGRRLASLQCSLLALAARIGHVSFTSCVARIPVFVRNGRVGSYQGSVLYKSPWLKALPSRWQVEPVPKRRARQRGD